MLCRKPFVRGASAFGCGQCMPCRFNRRRVWTHRLMIEALVHPSASFVTLTYEEVPDGGSLVPKDLQLWLKRFREVRGPCRYYAVGEYGDQTERPHYHLALFGHDRECTEDVSRTWGKGHVYVGTLTFHSAQYIAGYVTKKLTKRDDPRLGGRYPEFARMSLRPGIGAYGAVDIAKALQSKAGWDEIERFGDVPASLLVGRKSWPLGRYIRMKIRDAMEWEENGQPEAAAIKQNAEMLALYADYLANAESPLGIRDMINRRDSQKILNMETRQKIFAQKGKVI